ncbi:MAG: hypothetical protein KAU14_00100, partial [Thermoplasmata archaeon]|nr:hypothetical protein [Thermoplasmata archaeon]
MRLKEHFPASVLRPISLVIIGILVVLTLFILASGDVRGDPQSDPYVEDNDIEVPSKPNEGDMVTINVSLHNIGEDAPVYVYIKLKNPKGSITQLLSESLTLNESATSYVETTWNSTKKKVGDYTVMVEIKNLTEDMNTTNNTADKIFTLYARPIVNSLTASDTDVYRLSSVEITVDGEDIETDEENLTLKIQARPSSGGDWNDSFFSAPYWNATSWFTNFTPPAAAELGDYDFRARFIDDNNGTSDWYERKELVYVMNNPPEIDGTIPDVSIEEDTNLTLDLTPYESDKEDSTTALNWYVQSYNSNAVQSIIGQNSTDDSITFVPQANFTGNISVVLVLKDKDGGTDSQVVHLNWTSVNDPPRLLNASFSANQVYRDQTFHIFINATDDNTTEGELNFTFQCLYLDPGIGNWTNLSDITFYYSPADYWIVNITPPINAAVGNYSIRFNITDDNTTSPGVSRYYYYNSSIEVLNNLPSIIDITLTPNSSSVLRNNTIVFTINGTDVEDAESALNLTVEYRYKKYGYNPFPGAWYDTANSTWSFNFTPSVTAGIGNYTFKARFTDKDGGKSNWMEKAIVVLNNLPVAVNLSLSADTIEVNHTLYAYANGTDVEDLESKLTPTLKYRTEPGGDWESGYVSSYTYVGDVWVITIDIPENAALGNYSIRIVFTDLDGDASNNITKIDALHVINNPPIVLNMGISTSTLPRTQTAVIYSNADCDLDEEDELDAEFEYYHLGAWNNSFLSNLVYNHERWEIDFTPDTLDSTMGNYSFRVRLRLRESAWSEWFYLQNGTNVVNSLPEVEDLGFSSSEVYRSDSITVRIDLEDAEDSENVLNFTLQYSHDDQTWETGYLSIPTYNMDHYNVTFTPPLNAQIGNYTFRVNVSDTEGDSSNWYSNLTKVWVKNNPPFIVGGSIPGQEEKEENPLYVRLTDYEGDKEDGNYSLDWEVADYNTTVIIQIDLDPNYDRFTFHPAVNFTGLTNVTLKLTDSDGGYVLTNLTINWTSVNDAPVIDSVWIDNTTVYRNENLTVYINVTDDDDPNFNLTPFLHYSED